MLRLIVSVNRADELHLRSQTTAVNLDLAVMVRLCDELIRTIAVSKNTNLIVWKELTLAELEHAADDLDNCVEDCSEKSLDCAVGLAADVETGKCKSV